MIYAKYNNKATT